MSRYKMVLRKDGYMKFISHLDMVRLLKISFKRAGIRLAYSQGFNPHPKLSFALPLSLGQSSRCEVLEFETKETISAETAKDQIEALLPAGVDVLSCQMIPEEGKSLASRVTGARYRITIPAPELSLAEIHTLFQNFQAQGTICAVKKSKKNKLLVETDIKTKIQEMKIDKIDDNIILSTLLDAGGASNLNPALLADAFVEYAQLSAPKEAVSIHREELIFANH